MIAGFLITENCVVPDVTSSGRRRVMGSLGHGGGEHGDAQSRAPCSRISTAMPCSRRTGGFARRPNME
jgi:hypothetical protein